VLTSLSFNNVDNTGPAVDVTELAACDAVMDAHTFFFRDPYECSVIPFRQRAIMNRINAILENAKGERLGVREYSLSCTVVGDLSYYQ
jgi:hypothetical protein